MINYKNGVVTCDKCSKIIGNYFTCLDANGNEKSYYSLIKTKYCPDCKKEVVREQKRKHTREYKKNERYRKAVLQEQLRLAKAENKILRIKLFGTENAEQHRALVDLLKA